jgi:ANTAR domain
MRFSYRQTADAPDSRVAKRDRGAAEPAATGGEASRRPQPSGPRSGAHAAGTVTSTPVPADTSVARRTPEGWRVGEEDVPDLTSAMVLADLLAAELTADSTAELTADSTPHLPAPQAASPPGRKPSGPPAGKPAKAPRGPKQASDPATADYSKLARTVAQLEHALSARVRVEQAIGVLSERHRLRPRQAFELLRSAARARGKRVMEIATEVVDSATNPLLRIPEELAKPPVPRRGGRGHRRTLENS